MTKRFIGIKLGVALGFMKRVAIHLTFTLLGMACSNVDFFERSETDSDASGQIDKTSGEQPQQDFNEEDAVAEEDRTDLPTWINGVNLTCDLAPTQKKKTVQVNCSIFEKSKNVLAVLPSGAEIKWEIFDRKLGQYISFEELLVEANRYDFLTPADRLEFLRIDFIIVYNGESLKREENIEEINDQVNNETFKDCLKEREDTAICFEDSPVFSLDCPENFIAVNPQLDTVAPFCVAKYEMKLNIDTGLAESVASGEPWRGIRPSEALTHCQNMGAGFRLISNTQWMIVADQIASHPNNWSSGVVGNGRVNRGHSDGGAFLPASMDDNDSCSGLSVVGNCSLSDWHDLRRIHFFGENDDVIWDMAGNTHDLIDLFVVTDKPTPAVGSWQELSSLSASSAMPGEAFLPVNNTWTNSSHGIGMAFLGTEGNGGYGQRGGSRGDGENSGIYAFAIDMGNSSNGANGFRCVFTP